MEPGWSVEGTKVGWAEKKVRVKIVKAGREDVALIQGSKSRGARHDIIVLTVALTSNAYLAPTICFLVLHRSLALSHGTLSRW